MRMVLRSIPAVVVLWLFMHLRQAGGLAFDVRWSDWYLLISWLVFSPMYRHNFTALKADVNAPATAKHAVYNEVRQRRHLYADYVNGTNGITSMLFEDGTLDGVMTGLLRYGLTVIMILIAPGLWLFSVIAKLRFRGANPS